MSAENVQSVQGFKAPRAGKWRVTYWKPRGDEALGSHHTDPYLWGSEISAEVRVREYMAAGASSASQRELYLEPDGTMCEFDELAPGAFEVCEGPPGNFGLRFMLPGRSGANYIPIVKGPATGTGHGPWGWDGNWDCPTVAPSIHHVGYWHGFFEKGFFRSC